MAKAYFLNAQTQSEISIQLNGGQWYTLAALNSPATNNPCCSPDNPCCCVGLAVEATADILGTASVNTLSVKSDPHQPPIVWTIQMTDILSDKDIQFLVFQNALLARQRDIVKGFTITQQ